jgi:hypothetical protein
MGVSGYYKMDLRDVGCEEVRWMELAQDHSQRWDFDIRGIGNFGFYYW